ncbi:MAG: carboxypeptidase-like regulatory domain-containing protein, partial [Planctomycetota bacterium]
MRTVSLFLLALVVGIGVGFLVGSARETTARAPRQAPSDFASEELPPLDRAERQDLQGVLQSLPRPNLPSGNGTITGHVRRAGGAPLEGVTVRAHLRRESGGWQQGDGPPEEVSEVESVRRHVADLRRRRGTRGEAVTDAGGAYAIDGLVQDAPYSLRAYREGFQINPVLSRNAWNAAPGSEIDFHAFPLVAIPVDVRLPDGSQPDRAEIAVKQGSSTTTTTWTPRRPVLRARPGEATLRATIPSDDQLHSTELRLELVEGQAVKTQAFELQSRPGVRGQVRFPNGEHAGYLNAYLLRIGAEARPSPANLVQHGQQVWLSPDEGYGFAYKDLEPGRYMIGIALGRTALLAHRTVAVSDHMAECVFEITEFDPSQFVVLRVYDPDGSPLTDAEIETAYRTENSSSSGGGQSMRRKDG